MVAQPEEPDKRPDILDLNDPDAEGLFVGDELHSDTCPCDGCAEYWAAWQERYDKYVVPRTDAERRRDSTALIQAAKERRAAAKASREKEEDHEAWLAWDKLMAEAQVLKLAEDDLWVEEQWQKHKPEWEKQEAEQLLKHLEETDPWEALRMRERAVKDRELTRRENRQDSYDADDSTGELANVEPDWDTFNAMTMKVERATIGKLPAILSPNPPKDTDGRREESGRGVRELQGK